MEQTFFDCEEGDASSHPINALVGTEACRKVERTMKTSRDTTVSWKRLSVGGEQSVMGCLQLFSDCSQISRKARAVQFYSLHEKLMNFLN